MITKLRRMVNSPNKILSEGLSFLLGAVLGLLVLIAVVWIVSKEVILPGIRVAGISLAGKDTFQAKKKLTEESEKYSPVIYYGQTKISVPKNVITFGVDASIIEAQKLGRVFNSKNVLAILSGKTDLPIETSINNDEFSKWIEELSSWIDIPGKPASFISDKTGTSFQNGKDGITLDIDLLKENLIKSSEYLSNEEWAIPTKEERLALTPDQERLVGSRIKELSGKTLKIKIDEAVAELKNTELISLIDLTPQNAGNVANETVQAFVQGLADRYERAPQDAKFEFSEGRVKEFAPGLDGISIKQTETVEAITKGVDMLLGGETQVQVNAELLRVAPTVSTAQVNNLGITELIGRGESYYAHSIPNRVFNVGLASSRVNGTLVPPGEEFSFNKEVGEITGATGYKTAYVIQNGRTELGDGGGVCQVSTTLFRAAMNAGLPITERWAHAYRVGYYEQNSKPGIDATVYSPSKDFKFKNDTGSYILVQTINDPKNLHLIFELYGTKDGRVSTITTPRISNVSPPPPDLYQDDPTLPVGQTKQVDWSAWGAKAEFDYKVEKNGEVVFAKTFVSNYRPWANVYLKGTMGQ